MATAALGTPVLVSACFVIASIFSRSAAEIGAGVCACRSEVASKIKRQMARRFLGRDMGYMHLSLGAGTVYGLRSAVRRVAFWCESTVAVVTGSCRAALGLDPSTSLRAGSRGARPHTSLAELQ